LGSLLKGDREFEKNKREILRRIKNSNPNLAMIDSKISTKNENSQCGSGSRKYAWEYEVEEYRKKKHLERFYKIGALCGIASLVITIIDRFMPIKEITYTAISSMLN
jgi:hypothetical protein